MDQPQRANAAQLAARNIKSAKAPRPGIRGRHGSQPPVSTTQQQFAPMQTPSQNGGGGLFGGSIQAPGEFNFSAPAQGLSLPTPSFGPRSNTMNTPSQDTPAGEGRFAGDDRATKRQFGGPSTIQQSNSPFQTSNPFGQSQAQQPLGGSIFPFGDSQQSRPSGISFNSGSTTPAPANNPFAFQPAPQPTPTTPTSSFGSGSFNFNQQPSQNGALFGSTPAAKQDKPANSPFLFGQTSGQPTSSSTSFNSTPAPTMPTNNLFGSASNTTTALPKNNFFGSNTSAAPASSGLFGSTLSTAPPTSSLFGTPKTAPQQDKPTNSPFFFGQALATPPSSGINIGTTPAPSVSTSNFFGSAQPQQPTQPTNSFVSTTTETSSSSNPFAHLNAPASPVSNAFGKQEQKTAASNPFGALNPVQASTANGLFGNPAQAPPTPNKSSLLGQQEPRPSPASNIFGNLNKPTASITEPSNQDQQVSAGSVFGNKETKMNNDLFGTLNKPVDQSVAQPKMNGSIPESGPNASPSISKPAPATNIFGASKPTVSTPMDIANAFQDRSDTLKFTASPASNGVKPSLGSTQPPQASGNMFSSIKPLDAPASASQPPPNGMFPILEQGNGLQKSGGPPWIPGTSAGPSTSDSSKREQSRSNEASARQYLREASEMTDESLARLMPQAFAGFQKKAFYQGYRMSALNKAMSTYFASLNPDEDATFVLQLYMDQRSLIIGDTAALKRKLDEATDDVNHPSKRSKQSVESSSIEPHEQQSKRKLDDEDQENENPSKRTRQIEALTPARGFVNGEVNSNEQASTSVNGTNLQSWKAPSSGHLSSTETPLKRKADDQITKDSGARNPLRQIKTPKTNGAVEYNLSGSSTSNIFRNILDSPTESLGNASPERKMAGLPETSKDDAPRTNAFANLPGVSSPAKSANAPSSTMFPAKATSATSSVSSQNLFALSATPGTPNPFVPKPAPISTTTTTTAGSVSTDQKPNVLKPPIFGNVATNFQEQFAQKAEEEALKKAIEEDYDSDDGTLEEFKTNWKVERLEKKTAIEESAKTSKGFTFVPSIAAPSATPSSLFIQNPSSQASNSISSSVNSSRTPTPAFGSSTGSVFDGHTPGQPFKFSKSNNIFGHLSDADSGKGGDADDESGDEASEPEGDSEKKDPTYQPDGESTSGPSTPVEETGPGLASASKTTNPFAFKADSGSPSGTNTPTKSFNGGLFDRIAPKDNNASLLGTNTPNKGFTGGLFDRITPKDGSGNMVRNNFDEEKEKEKENTQPSTANPFGDMKGIFNKSTAAPTDNTWKPDSPIRFGSATPSKDGLDSTPTVSVTAATPTKTGSASNVFSDLNKTTGSVQKPFPNLFGHTSGETKPAAPTSNMFGHLATSATPGSVGFAFGERSATSSLFPSAAASETTSRATTPGGTTDGDNSADGEAEEKHVDFNLSAKGPGEENEDVIHEVRVKALRYSPPKEGSDNSNVWENKGVGPLRVLKHKETGVTRILLRSLVGVIILNKGLLSGAKYESKEKTVKFLTTVDGEEVGLETWILQVKTPEFAKALAEVLEANKPT